MFCLPPPAVQAGQGTGTAGMAGGSRPGGRCFLSPPPPSDFLRGSLRLGGQIKEVDPKEYKENESGGEVLGWCLAPGRPKRSSVPQSLPTGEPWGEGGAGGTGGATPTPVSAGSSGTPRSHPGQTLGHLARRGPGVVGRAPSLPLKEPTPTPAPTEAITIVKTRPLDRKRTKRGLSK